MHYRIEGPAKLGGRFKPAGNKNAALPILAGSLLADDLVVLDNVPDIRDVRTMIELMESVGATASWEEGGRVVVDPRGVTGGELDADLSRRIRASILMAGPLLARTGSIVLPPPGGDVIGRRRLDTHFLALGKLGAEVEVGDRYELRTRGLEGADIFLDEPSVTGTENAILAAVTAEGTTRLRNAAAEPHVQDLCAFLVSMGAEIQGIGTHGLVIQGVDRLGGTS
ncbi:MAG: UDP-N-acetylglucosamine 1-carboxyvinyltransferase, partial [Gemmatimonadales bacterium]